MANRSSNTAAVPEAKGALDRFKMEVAGELGVPLTDGYNGNLTSRQNGSVGGYMVKKMIEAQERQMSGQNGMSGQSGRRLPDVSLAGKTGKKTGAGDFSPAPVFFRMITVLHFRLRRRLQHSKLCFLRVSDKR